MAFADRSSGVASHGQRRRRPRGATLLIDGGGDQLSRLAARVGGWRWKRGEQEAASSSSNTNVTRVTSANVNKQTASRTAAQMQLHWGKSRLGARCIMIEMIIMIQLEWEPTRGHNSRRLINYCGDERVIVLVKNTLDQGDETSDRCARHSRPGVGMQPTRALELRLEAVAQRGQWPP